MVDFDAGRAFVQVVPSFRGIQTLIGKEAKKWGRDAGREFDDGFDREVGRSVTQVGPGKTASRKQGADAGGSFADGFKRKVEAAMRSLPPVKIGPVQSGTVDAKLRELRLDLERLSRNTIGVDLDAGDAMAELARIDRQLADLDHDGADVRVRVDAGAARAQLAAVQAQVNDLDRDDVNIRVDADNASLNTFTGRLLLLGAAGAALAPAIVPAAGAAAGALAAIGPAALVGLGGIAALAIGFQGIGDALKAMGAAQESAAEDAERAAGQQASAARAVASAQRQLEGAERALANTRANVADQAEAAARRVADAQRGVADATEDAADRVQDALREQRDAEADLEVAQRRVRDAQLDLTRARQDAREALEDLALSTRSAALAEEDAELGLARARERLAETMAEGVGGLDLQEAQLAVQQAELRLDQARDRNQDVQAEAKAAEKAGVDGAQAVLQAQQRLDDARASRAEQAERVAAAEQAVTDARLEGAERVLEAEQRVTDAIAAQERQQRQSAFAVAGAIASVEGAQAALQAASVSTGVTGSAAMRKLEKSMEALSPAGREFATFLFGLKPLWDDIVARAQEGLLPGVQAGLEALMPVMPAIIDGIGVFADVMGDFFAATGEALASPAWQSFFERMVDAAPLLLTMGEAFGTLALGLGNLFLGFAPLAERMFEALLGVAEVFVEWTESAGFQEFLDRFIGYVLEAGPQLLDFFGSLLDAIVNLVRSMLPFAPVVLGIVGAFLDLIAALPPGVLAGIVLAFLGLVTAFNLLAPILSIVATVMSLGLAPALLSTIGTVAAVVGGIMLLVGALVAAYMHSETFRNIVDTAFRAVGTAAKWLWNEAIKPAFKAIGEAIKWVWERVIKPAFAAYAFYVTEIVAPAVLWLWREVIQPAWRGIQLAIDVAWALIKVVLGAFEIYIRTVLAPVFGWLWRNAIKPAFDTIGSVISGVWNRVIKPVFEALGNFIEDTVAPAFRRGVDAIGRIWEGIKEAAKAPVRFVVETVINRGIIDNFNRIAAKVPGVDKIEEVVLPPGFATGGIYPGYTPGRDIGLIGVSGGEAIMRPEWTRAVGPQAIHAMNAAARSGGTAGVRAMLGGAIGAPWNTVVGWVGDRAHDISDAVVGTLRKAAEAALSPVVRLIDSFDGGMFGDLALGPARAAIDGILGFLGDKDADGPKLRGSDYQALTGFFRAAGLDGVVTSTLRPGDPGYHGRGKAADFSVGSHRNRGWDSPGLRAIFEAFLPVASSLSELILAGAPFNIKNGRQVDGYAWGTPGSPGNHWNHVHAALFDQGGHLPPGLTLALNATGSPERVLNRQQESQIDAALSGRIRGGDGPTYHLHPRSDEVRDAIRMLDDREWKLDRTAAP